MHAHLVELKFCGYLFQSLGAPGVSITLGSNTAEDMDWVPGERPLATRKALERIAAVQMFFHRNTLR